jgi:hypothetical protein
MIYASPSIPLMLIVTLQAAREKPWFRKLLDDVRNKLKEI